MEKVVLGLSGGVDSAAASILLKQKGYEVIALYFDVVKGKEEERNKAEKLASLLNIQFIYKDLSHEFNKIIIQDFCTEYQNGRTPNPCIFCNPLIKWKVLKETADELGAKYISSGHYARIKEIDGIYYVQKAVNIAKDQSYMLSRLGQDILSRVIFPLGEIGDKQLTRKIVQDLDIETSQGKDSQDICFINNNYVDYLKMVGITAKTARFISSDKKLIQQSDKPIYCFTIGQRKGLGIALGSPCFVTKIDAQTGDVTLSTDENDLFKDQVLLNNVFKTSILNDGKYMVKLRYAGTPAECELINRGKYIILSFKMPQRAPTPGQAAVIYADDIVVGCGIIC